MLICINGVEAKSFCCRRKSFDHLIGNGESSTTNKADIPPLHCRPRHKCTGQTKQSIWKGFAYVRFGSKADICTARAHVRFTPESGHVRCNSLCPLWAKSGHPVSIMRFNACHSGTPVPRSASLRAAARAGAQSTPANCRDKRNAGSRSKSCATHFFASSCRPSFANGAASSM